MIEKPIILNIDINTVTCPFLKGIMEKGTVSEKDLYPFIDQYIDAYGTEKTRLGAIALNTFCQFSSTKSQVMTDIFTYTEKKATAGDNVKDKWYEIFHRINKEFGIEPWGVWVKRCRERGVEPWLSIRMNDAHDTDYEESLKDEFAFRAKWNGYAIGDKYGYYWKCLDYAEKEVRDHFLDYIKEQLDIFDVDAVELDFMREIYCFKYLENPDCYKIMNGFMRNVKEIVNKSAEKRGHKIKISARLHRDIAENKVFGFDVETWAKEKLVDHITVTPRWSSSDDAMPIKEWKEKFPSVEIAAGTEILLRFADMSVKDSSDNSYIATMDPDIVNGLAANYFSQGADGLYLYNFFLNPLRHTLLTDITSKVLTTCGEKEKILNSPRRHIIMYQEIYPEGFKPYKPLPIKLEGNTAAETVTVHTGFIPDNKEAYLILGFTEGTPSDVEIKVNGAILTDFAPTEISLTYENGGTGNLVRLKLDENYTLTDGSKINFYKRKVSLNKDSGSQDISFGGNNAAIHYIEITL